MPVRPIEIMEKHTYDADKDGRIEKDAIEITLNKLLKGAGGADPTEIDGDNAFYGLLSQGLASARPAAGVIGCLYYSTDTKVLERDNGTTWDEVARGETVTRLAQLSEKAHSSLTGIGASDHHAKTAAASEITSGRFVLARLPDGTAGYFLKAGGAGVDSAFAALAAADIASGRLVLARMPDGTSGYFLKAGGAGIDPAYAVLVAADIPSLNAAKITTGRFGVARMPDGTSGRVLTAQGAGVDPVYAAVAVPTIVRKTADEDVKNSTTLQNDDHLFFAIAANEIWQFEAYIYFRNLVGETPNIQMAFTTPTGATINYVFIGSAAGAAAGAVTRQYSDASGGVLTADYIWDHPVLLKITGLIINGGTAGNLQFQFAQNTISSTQTTRVLANSCLIAHKLA